jgi:hypothetical protein
MRSLRGLDFFGLTSKGENEGFKGVIGLVGVEGSPMPMIQQERIRGRELLVYFKGSCLHQERIRCRAWETVFCQPHHLRGILEEEVVAKMENLLLLEEEGEVSDP